jgi:hypothetical protein
MTLEDSTTYQLLIQKGRMQEARALIIRLGTKRFGEAPSPIFAAIQGITDHDRLLCLADRVLDANGWEELIST